MDSSGLSGIMKGVGGCVLGYELTSGAKCSESLVGNCHLTIALRFTGGTCRSPAVLPKDHF